MVLPVQIRTHMHILAVFVTLSFGVSAGAQLHCGPLFSITTSVSTFTPIDQTFAIFQSPRLQETAAQRGHFGGRILSIQQKTYAPKKLFGGGSEKSYAWYDYGTQADQPGDMRTASEFLPTQLKQYFSIKALRLDLTEVLQPKSDEIKILTIPDFKESSSGLKVLEAEVQKKDSNFKMFHFYEAAQIVTGKTFLQNLATQAAFPLSSQGHLFEHDFNYHFLSALVTPPRIVKAVQKRAQIILLFHDYVIKNAGRFANLKSLSKDYENKVFKNATQRFDLLANVFVHLIANKNTHSLEINLKEMTTDLQNIFLQAESPKAYLQNLLAQSHLTPYFGNRKFDTDLSNLFADFEMQLPDTFLKKDLQSVWLSNAMYLDHEVQAQMHLLNDVAASRLESVLN